MRWHQPLILLHACARLDRHSCATHRSAPQPPQPPQSCLHSRVNRLCQPVQCQTLAVNIMMDVDRATGAAKRRRDRRLRSWWRHEAQSVAAALTTACHHSAGPPVVTRCEKQHDALRGLSTPLLGTRPVQLADALGSLAKVERVACPCSDVPLLARPAFVSEPAHDDATVVFSRTRWRRDGGRRQRRRRRRRRRWRTRWPGSIGGWWSWSRRCQPRGVKPGSSSRFSSAPSLAGT